MVQVFLLTVFIFFSNHVLLTIKSSWSLSKRIIGSILLTLVQITLTQLILGLSENLYATSVIVLNLGISGLILGFSFYAAKAFNKGLVQDFLKIKQEVKEIFSDKSCVVIGLLAVILVLWLFIVVIFLPPRGSDDLTYHLPFVYQSIQDHKISFLPSDIRAHFSFPFGGELFFIWVALLSHSITWVDGVQLFFALIIVCVMYVLGRWLGISKQKAFFVSLLFLFTPIVICQSLVNYIDVIIVAFYLLSLYFALEFYCGGKSKDLLFAAMGIGLLFGTKYLAVVFMLFLLPFVFPKIRKKPFDIIISGVIVLVIGGYWYFRNMVVLGQPIDIHGVMSEPAHQTFGLRFLIDKFYDFRKTWLLVLFQDVNAGTFDGGLGVIYRVLGFLSWILVFAGSFFSVLRDSKKTFLLLFWCQGFIGIILLSLVPVQEIQYCVRYGIVLLPFGYLAMGKIWQDFIKHSFIDNSIKFIYFLITCFSISLLLTISIWPSFNISEALVDHFNHKPVSEFKYLKNSARYFQPPRYAFEPLDFMTKNDTKGFDCYIAIRGDMSWLANVYGTKLQNRIWNFKEDLSASPDAYFYQWAGLGEMLYYGKKFDFTEVALDPDNILITNFEGRFLFVKKESLQMNDRLNQLVFYYQETFPRFIDFGRNVISHLDPQIPLIVTDQLGVAFQYLKLKGEMKNEFYWLPLGLTTAKMIQGNGNVFYSLFKPDENFKSELEMILTFEDRRIPIYKNQL